MAQLKILVTISTCIMFVAGCLALGYGIYFRFIEFENFKVWQWSMALGGTAVFLTAVIAFLNVKVIDKVAGGK